MKLKDYLLEYDCTLLLTGTIIPEKMEMINGILQNNFHWFEYFKNIVLVLNTTDMNGERYLNDYLDVFEDVRHASQYTGNFYFIRDYINRGWQFGTIDMEKLGYQFIYDNIRDWSVLKLDFDIYLENQFLDFNIDNDVDVYYMPSVGASTVNEQGITKLLKDYDDNWPEYIKPQTIIYLATKPLDPFYPIEDWLNDKYKEWILHPVGNGPHHIGVACEPLLMGTFEKNDCKIKMMISKETFEKLLETIKIYQFHDPSHKNIMFEEIGVCHLADDKKEVIRI